jgi:glycerate dehydrogenase
MKICILDGHTMNPGDLSWRPIEELGSVEVYPRMKPLEVIEYAADAEVILTNKVPIGRDMMDLLTRLKYIGVLATGFNNIDTSYAAQLELPVTNIPGYSRDSVAQSVFAYILHACNAVAEYDRSVKNGDWESCRDFSYLKKIPVELAGKTLGIVGYGDIGARVAAIGRAFGMRILAAKKPDGKIPGRAADDVSRSLAEACDLEELFAGAEYISLNLPLNDESRNFVNEALLSRCRPGTVLVNTARGPVIDEAAVLDALDDGILACYAADVYDKEPPGAGSSLIHHPKSLFTPHIAWASAEARKRAIDIAAANISAWKDGKPVNVVNGILRGRG